jgi:hypothetical protein
MSLLATIFQEFNLPNAATWFYLSLLLAVALFFKFSRLLSLRNWDVLALFLLVPGLLLRQENERKQPQPDADPARSDAAKQPPNAEPRPYQPRAFPSSLSDEGPPEPVTSEAMEKKPKTEAATEGSKDTAGSARLQWFAYLWLLCGSVYFLARCLMDLALERRPALGPNLNFGGLAWLAVALFVCLVVVAVRRPMDRTESAGDASPALGEIEKGLADALKAVKPKENQQLPKSDDMLDWAQRILALLCQLAVVAALIFIGYRHFQDGLAGMAAATFYLLLPYTASFVEKFHHVWPTAFLLWAVALYRMPVVAGSLVGLAAGVIYFPALTVPLWLGFYWKRGAGRFLAAFTLTSGLSLAILGLILWTNGELARKIQSALEGTDWQPWTVPVAQGFWRGVHWAYRMPVFIAYVAFVLTTAFWPSPKNLAHLIALLAAVLIGIQFWFADEGGKYVLWYLPFLLLLAFRPNLSDRVPPAIHAETDWLNRLGRRTARSIKKRPGIPEPAAPVQ